jgi:hypothetical protein
MIATTQPPLPEPCRPPPAVADPRRSYDRGAWVATMATETSPESRMTEPIDLSKLSSADLRREIERRERELHALIAKRDKLAAELAALDAQIRELEGHSEPSRTRGRPAARGRHAKLVLPRPKNSISLTDAIAMAVEPGATVTPTEVANLVLANGYQTAAAKFAMGVANALNKNKGFKRVGREQYQRSVG